MNVANLLVTLGIETGQFEQNLAQAATSFERGMGRMEQSVQAFQTAGIAMAAAGGAIAGFLGIAAVAAGRAEESFARLSATVQGSSQQLDIRRLEELSHALERTTTTSAGATQGVMTLLAGFQLSQGQIEALTPRVLDLAAHLGVDTETAARRLGLAMSQGGDHLVRLGVVMREGLDPISNFTEFLAALDRTAGGTAERMANTLPGAFAQARNAVTSLMETLGAPMQGPIVAVLKLFADFVHVLSDVAKEHPAIVALAEAFASLAAGALLTGAAIAGFGAIIGRLPGILEAIHVGIGAIQSLLTSLPAALRLVGIAFSVMVDVIAANPIGALLLVAAAVLVYMIAQIEGVQRAFGAVLGELGRFAAFFVGFVSHLLTIRGLIEVLGETVGLIPPKQDRWTESAEQTRASIARMNAAMAEHLPLVERVAQRYKDLQADIDAAATHAKTAATELARGELQGGGGMSEAEIQGVEARRTGIIRAAEEQRLQESAATNQRAVAEYDKGIQQRREALANLQATAKGGSEEEVKAATEAFTRINTQLQKALEERKGAHKAFEDDLNALAGLRYEREREVLSKIAEAEKQLFDTRTNLVQQTGQAYQAENQKRGDQAKEGAQASVQAEQQAAQRALEGVRASEELRVALIRSYADQERSLREAALSIMAAQSTLAGEREGRQLQEDNAHRADLVRRGVLTEVEAKRQQQRQEEEIGQQRLAREIAIEQARIEAIKAEAQAAIEVAGAERDAKIRELDAETAARRVQITTEAALRDYALQIAVQQAKYETQVKQAEVQAQLGATLAGKQAELAGARERGAAPAEIAAREAEITALMKGQGDIRAVQMVSEAQKAELLNKELLLGRQQLAAQLEALDATTAMKRDAIYATSNAGLLQQNARLTAQLQEEQLKLLSLREQAPAGGLPAANLPTGGLGGVAALPLPTGRPGPGGLPTAQSLVLVPSAPTPAGAGALGVAPPPTPAGGGGAGGGATADGARILNINGTVVRLEADKVALFSELLQYVLGPEGAAAVEDFLRQTPGPRTPAAR